MPAPRLAAGLQPAALLTQSKPGNGIGLKNTQERLAYFYPHEHSMIAVPLHTGGYEVTIDVPYERAL